ncbi:hypothetical protein CcrBL47_gp298 [Caulobacter phage BL47]|nr:hypothetical protein CcrBL47_gp298 [Caulobacter phage BL47]
MTETTVAEKAPETDVAQAAEPARNPNLPLLFHTEYISGGRKFGGLIEAEDMGHAQLLAARRNLNERIISQGFQVADPGMGHFGYHLAEGDYVAALHDATYMTYLGMEAGVITPREALGDRGLLHEMAHLIQEGDDRHPEDPESRLLRLRGMWKDLSGRVPGFPLATLDAYYRRDLA